MIESLKNLAGKLEQNLPLASALPVVAGFDAFIDEVMEIVGVRESPERYSRVPTIAEYGNWVGAAAGKSGLREFVVTARTAGGCAINLGEGLATLGFPLDAFIGLGESKDGAFAEFYAKCRSFHSLDIAPGRSLVS